MSLGTQQPTPTRSALAVVREAEQSDAAALRRRVEDDARESGISTAALILMFVVGIPTVMLINHLMVTWSVR